MLLAGVFFLVRNKKDHILKQFSKALVARVARETDLTVHIGKTRGHIFGLIELEDVAIRRAWLEDEQSTVFKAKKIQVRYRFLDFLSKKFDSRVEVRLESPEIFWSPRVSVRRPKFTFMKWMREWALTEGRKHLSLHIENLALNVAGERRLEGVQLDYEDNAFRAVVPLRHVPVAVSDVSTIVNVSGRFELAIHPNNDFLSGEIKTEGTVIDWKPLPYESAFDFLFSQESFNVMSSNFLGGLQLTGKVDFQNDYNIDFSVKGTDYLFSNLTHFSFFSATAKQTEKLDIDIRFEGSPWAPHVDSRLRVHDGWIGKRSYSVMDLNMIGIYPTLKLVSSRILLSDGSVMKIADRALEASQLFKSKTYEKLITDETQDTVVWGDWELSRQEDSNEQPEFTMQRSLGENARVHFRKFTEDDEQRFVKQEDPAEVEVGFEYRLRSKDSLKLELRDNEEFVKVERKMTF